MKYNFNSDDMCPNCQREDCPEVAERSSLKRCPVEGRKHRKSERRRGRESDFEAANAGW